MWGGPNYYVPPYGLLGYGAGYGGYGYVPSGGAAVVGRGGSTVANSGTTNVNGRAPAGAAPVKVPIFAGPNAMRNGVAPVAVIQQPSSHASFASGYRGATGPVQSRAVSSAAGPSIGHVAAARGGYSGAVRGGGTPQAGYSGAAAAPRGTSGNAASMSRGSSGMSAGAGARSAAGGGGTRGR
jgi:hypothetical protein